MSGIITGLVWDLPIVGEFGRPEKYVLLAYGDHADQNGRNVFPSVELISRKTGYEERSVQSITRKLEELGYLVADGQGPHGTNRWMIPLERDAQGGAKIAPRIPVQIEPATPPDMAGSKPAARGAKIAPEGIAPEGTAPELGVEVKKIQEEEGKPAPIFDFSQALTDRLEQAGVYRHNWTDVALYLRAGNSEADVLAVMAWMHDTSHGDATRAAQRFVTRIRERSKAPAKYYPLQAPEGVCEGVCVSDGAGNTADLAESGGDACAGDDFPFPAWTSALQQLQLEMPKESFRRYVEPCRVLEWREQDGELVILAADHDACDWLESRLTSTLQRLLAGILNRQDVHVTWLVCVASAEVQP
jgi:hypothetical protein